MRVEIEHGALDAFLKVLRAFYTKDEQESYFYISRDGLRTRVVDAAHIGMVKLHLEPFVFRDERNLPHKDTRIAYDWSALFDVVKHARKHASQLALAFEDGVAGQPGGKLFVEHHPLIRRIKTYAPETVYEPKVSELKWTASTMMPTREMKLVIKNAASISDHVRMFMNRDSFNIEAEGDGADIKASWKNGALSEFSYREEKLDRVRSLFALEYVTRILSVCEAPFIFIELGTDYPLGITSMLRSSAFAEPIGKAEFLLAPRISE